MLLHLPSKLQMPFLITIMLIMMYYLYSLTTVIHDQTQNITQIGIRLKRNIHPTIHYWSSVDDKLTYPNQNEIQQAAPTLTTSPSQLICTVLVLATVSCSGQAVCTVQLYSHTGTLAWKAWTTL